MRAVSPAGLLYQEGVQNAQKAKPSRLEHLPAGLGGGLRGHSTPLPVKVPAVYHWYLTVWWSL